MYKCVFTYMQIHFWTMLIEFSVQKLTLVTIVYLNLWDPRYIFTLFYLQSLYIFLFIYLLHFSVKEL